jgi:hypothetical protein
MFAYNDAALGSYREYGVDEVEAIDGDEDDECADRNGRTYPLEEALGITDHPNGTLDWVPVIKASLDEPDHQGEAWKAITAMATREAPPPIINVHPSPVTVHPPQVNVTSTDMTPVLAEIRGLSEQIANTPPPVVNVTAPKAGRKTIQRDADGRITGLVEE